MKILHAVHGLAPEFRGGVERYVEAVGEGQRASGIDVTLLAGSDEAAPTPTLRPETTAGGLPLRRLVGAAPHLERGEDRPLVEELLRGLLRELRPDLLHIHSWLRLVPNLAALAADEGVRSIATLHDLGLVCPRIHRIRRTLVFCEEPWSPALCTPCAQRQPWERDDDLWGELELRGGFVDGELRAASLLLVPSEAQRRFLVEKGRIPGDTLRVLPVALPGGVAPAAPAAAGPLRIGHWGNLLPAKGTDLLLEALARCPSLGNFELHLWGTAPDPLFEARLGELARALEPRGKVVSHGPFAPADLARQPLDLAVFPSLAHESHSFTLDEAFALGLPVIVSDRGAPAERVGGRGLVVPAGEVGPLAEALGRMADPALRGRLAAAAPAGGPVAFDDHLRALRARVDEAMAAPPRKGDPLPAPSDRLRAAERRLQARTRAHEALKVRHSELEVRATTEVESRDRELARLYAEVESRERELASARSDAQALREELARRDAELARLYGEEAALRGAMASRDRDLQRLYDDEAALRRELDARDDRIREFDGRFGELQARFDDLSRRHALLSAEHDGLRSRKLVKLALRIDRLRSRFRG